MDILHCVYSFINNGFLCCFYFLAVMENVANFIPFWMGDTFMISVLLNILGLLLWVSVWSILGKVPSTHKKNVCSVVGWGIQ